MCCCGKANVNGEPHAYSWDGKNFMTYTPNPPTLEDGDELIYDLPGRCGGTDSHSHHARMVKQRYGGFSLLVRHGGGDERLPLGRDKALIGSLETLDDTARYWFLMRFFHIHKDALRAAIEATDAKWRKAAANRCIKVRRVRGVARVSIESQPIG